MSIRAVRPGPVEASDWRQTSSYQTSAANMNKDFAELDSEGPDISNLQLRFWELAVHEFDKIKEHWTREAVSDDVEESETIPAYQAHDFEVDAAVAIVLAGTSVSELLGQNVAPQGSSVPSITEAWRVIDGTEPPENLRELVKLYNALRHFGPPKHEAVRNITEEDLCKHFHAVQNVWISVLRKCGRPIPNQFTHTFDFALDK
jgi:hypothetical protein